VLKAELDDHGFCEKYGASVQEDGPYQCDSIGHGWNREPKSSIEVGATKTFFKFSQIFSQIKEKLFPVKSSPIQIFT